MGIKRGIMKFPYFKCMLVAGAMFLAWNCSDESPLPLSAEQTTVSEEVKVLKTEKGTFYITEDNQVKNKKGEIIGKLHKDGSITSIDDGEVIYEGVDKDDLDDETLEYTVSSNSNGEGNGGKNSWSSSS